MMIDVLIHAMKTANQALRRHNNTFFDRLAVRSAAKEIEALYWAEAAPELSEGDDELDGEDEVRIGDDLTLDA